MRWPQTKFRIIPQLDRYPAAVEFAQRPLGKFVVILCALVPAHLLVTNTSVLYVGPWLLLISLFPGYRRPLVLCATLGSALFGLTFLDAGNIAYLPIYYGIGAAWDAWWIPPLCAGVFLAACWLLVEVTRRTSFVLLRRNPAWTALAFLTLFTLPLSYLSLPPVIEVSGWVLFLVGAKYIWFLAYSLQEARSPEQASFPRQLSFYAPFWYPSPLPVPKGSNYLEKIECKDAHSLAVCQLKGLKLLMWAMVLNVMVFCIEGFCYGEARDLTGSFLLQWQEGRMYLLWKGERLAALWQRGFIGYFPPMDFALKQIARGGDVLPAGKAWASTITYFFMDLAGLAAVTHAGIAFCRLAGFYALRNVYRPLEATSVADFWNRYYYYYKELLVTVFFFPSYFTLFKKHPRLRLFTATLLAAGLGNLLFHVLLDTVMIIDRGIIGTIINYQAFAFYGFLLASGIFLSQVNRKDKNRTETTGWRKVRTSCLILFFYCLIVVFSDLSTHDISANFKFFLSLFGVRP